MQLNNRTAHDDFKEKEYQTRVSDVLGGRAFPPEGIMPHPTSEIDYELSAQADLLEQLHGALYELTVRLEPVIMIKDNLVATKQEDRKLPNSIIGSRIYENSARINIARENILTILNSLAI